MENYPIKIHLPGRLAYQSLGKHILKNLVLGCENLSSKRRWIHSVRSLRSSELWAPLAVFPTLWRLHPPLPNFLHQTSLDAVSDKYIKYFVLFIHAASDQSPSPKDPEVLGTDGTGLQTRSGWTLQARSWVRINALGCVNFPVEKLLDCFVLGCSGFHKLKLIALPVKYPRL